MRRLLVAVLVGLAAFGAVTLFALEGREVVVIETTDARGAHRRTRTWIAEEGGSLWIEAANPERPMLADLRGEPTLVLERGGLRLLCRGEIAPDPEGHDRIRRLLAERYGWADRWIGLLADTHASLAIRLVCS